RDDWISLWWAQEDWFWSKPIFIFWAEAFFMGALGVPFAPDSNPGHPEWALRIPVYLVSMGALLAVGVAIRRAFGTRAGVLCALVLATTPLFFFCAHQAITDMPFVGCMTLAVSFFVLALSEDPEREVTTYTVGRIGVSARELAIAFSALAVLP